ncbi:MAG: nucleotidyltransferase family protein [Bacteroidales bacterium]|nr:nucleotidyltransferase family protein [Bacteroidales bacterium]
MKAMIFAAGLGTRLKPITDTMPKALVPVCGQPLLYHVITKLVAAGYDDLVVNVHHFPDQIIHYLHSHDFGAHIAVSDERDFLRETGGGIKYARPLLVKEEIPGQAGNDGNEPFLVHNVDIVSNLDLQWLRERHREGALATLVVSERKTQRYFLFDEGGRMKGWTNIATGEVRSPFPDIDPERCRKLAFAGIHLISPAIFDAFDRYGFGDRFSIVDFYLRACADYPIYAAVPPDFTLVDVGKKETLSEAERVCEVILR